MHLFASPSGIRRSLGHGLATFYGSLPGPVPAVQSSTHRRGGWHLGLDARNKSGHEPEFVARPCVSLGLTAGLDPAVQSGMHWQNRWHLRLDVRDKARA